MPGYFAFRNIKVKVAEIKRKAVLQFTGWMMDSTFEIIRREMTVNFKVQS